MTEIVIALAIYILLREAWFFYQVNVLINKLTSRGHYEYKLAESVGKQKVGFTPPKQDDGESEDIDGHLAGLG